MFFIKILFWTAEIWQFGFLFVCYEMCRYVNYFWILFFLFGFDCFRHLFMLTISVIEDLSNWFKYNLTIANPCQKKYCANFEKSACIAGTVCVEFASSVRDCQAIPLSRTDKDVFLFCISVTFLVFFLSPCFSVRP